MIKEAAGIEGWFVFNVQNKIKRFQTNKWTSRRIIKYNNFHMIRRAGLYGPL